MAPTAIGRQQTTARHTVERQNPKGSAIGWLFFSKARLDMLRREEALQALQRLRKPSTKIRFAEVETSGLPIPTEVLQATTRYLANYYTVSVELQRPSLDVEIELPAWKGPQAVRVQASVRKVSRGTFRPIDSSDIEEM